MEFAHRTKTNDKPECIILQQVVLVENSCPVPSYVVLVENSCPVPGYVVLVDNSCPVPGYVVLVENSCPVPSYVDESDLLYSILHSTLHTLQLSVCVYMCVFTTISWGKRERIPTASLFNPTYRHIGFIPQYLLFFSIV